MISSCSKVRCCPGQYSTPLLILHDHGFTGSKFHSSSLQRLCFKQELAGNTIALKRCDLLWGELRLIMIKRSGFLVSWGQTLCSQSGKDPLNRFISPMKIEWFMQAYSQYWGLCADTEGKKKRFAATSWDVVIYQTSAWFFTLNFMVQPAWFTVRQILQLWQSRFPHWDLQWAENVPVLYMSLRWCIHRC